MYMYIRTKCTKQTSGTDFPVQSESGLISRIWVRNYNAMQILPWRWLCNLTASYRTNLVSSSSLSDHPLKTQFYEP